MWSHAFAPTGVRPAAIGALFLATVGSAASEPVTFESRPPHGPSLTLSGDLTKPDGSGPFPAVVLLHGCNGPWGPWDGVWAGRLVERGFVALRVDSFGPRGHHRGICERDGLVGELATAEDGHAAKDYLQTRPFVDADRIGVMGMSHGGGAVLWSVQNTYIVDVPRPDPFEAAVSFYPSCVSTLYRLDAPLLILTGEMDDWTPSGVCERMTVEGPTDHVVTLKVYPKATHAFDVDLPERTYLGHTMRFDVAAARDTERRVLDFLARHLR